MCCADLICKIFSQLNATLLSSPPSLSVSIWQTLIVDAFSKKTRMCRLSTYQNKTDLVFKFSKFVWNENKIWKKKKNKKISLKSTILLFAFLFFSFFFFFFSILKLSWIKRWIWLFTLEKIKKKLKNFLKNKIKLTND